MLEYLGKTWYSAECNMNLRIPLLVGLNVDFKSFKSSKKLWYTT